MQYSAHQLVLFPVAAPKTRTAIPLAPCLQSVGLLGEYLGAGYFAVGEAFLSLVCFLGCAPDIELVPQKSKPFCYVQLPCSTAEVTFLLAHKPPVRVRDWVIIGNIHEAEAVPDAALLCALEAASECRWKYAYRH